MSATTKRHLAQRLKEDMHAYAICQEAAARIETLELALRQLLQATGQGPRHDAAAYQAQAVLNDRR